MHWLKRLFVCEMIVSIIMFLYFLFFSILYRKISTYYNKKTDSFLCVEGVNDKYAIARGFFENDNKTGWAKLQIDASEYSDIYVEARAAGFTEAVLTRDIFDEHFSNVMGTLCEKYIVCDDTGTPLNMELQAFFNANYDWVKEYLNRDTGDELFKALKICFNQFNGLVEGYNYKNDKNISVYDLWLYANHESLYNVARRLMVAKNAGYFYSQGSAFISHPGDFMDLFLGHASWKPYGYSRRISKSYNLEFGNFSQVSKRVISSYPFLLQSTDNFQITDNAVVYMSTSIALSNDVIQRNAPNNRCFPTWMKSISATQVSHSASQWYDYYKIYPMEADGIEHILVDLKQFKYHDGFNDGFLYIVDEIPGYGMTKSIDKSDEIDEKGYFVSVDIPSIEGISEAAGYNTLMQEDPLMFDKNQSPRMKIFQQKHDIVNYEELKSLIRLNDLAIAEQLNSPVNAIASRYDLLKDNCTWYGAIDGKTTSLRRILHLIWDGIASPSYDKLEPFVFSTSKCPNLPHDGISDKLQYKWTQQFPFMNE